MADLDGQRDATLMGIELVNLALLRHAPTLSGRAFKVLVRMASIALDQPNTKGQPARLYFAGDEPLLRVLYGDPTPFCLLKGHREVDRLPSQVRELRRVIAELRNADAIRPTVTARYDRRQCFELNLDLAGHPRAEGETPHPREGETPHPREGENAPRSAGNFPTPRKDLGRIEDSPQDHTPSVPALTIDRARSGSPDDRVDWAHTFTPDEQGEYCRICELPEANRRHALGRIA